MLLFDDVCGVMIIVSEMMLFDDVIVVEMNDDLIVDCVCV